MTGTIRRHPEGGWIADVTIGGCRRTRKAATKAEAARARAALVQELGSKPAKGAAGFTMAEARRLSLRIRWAGRASERVAGIYSRHAVEWFGADRPIASLRAAEVEEWRQALLRNGTRPGTINRKVSALRAMLSDAALHGHIDTVPTLPRQLKQTNGRERVLSTEEEAKLLGALLRLEEPMVADLVQFLIETGCRLGEALRLTGQDVDLKAKRVSFWRTKNGKPRTVPLTMKAVEALEKNVPAIPGRRVFPIDYHRLIRTWRKAKELVGLGDDEALVLHSLRHTCATRLARAGISLHQLQAWGGWTTMAACQRYLHHSVDSLGSCVAALEAGRQ